MTVARCLLDPDHCEWEVDFPDEAAANRGRDRHEALRHPDLIKQRDEPIEPHVPQPVRQLAHVDWWTHALDAIAQLARESMRSGEPFTVYDVTGYGVGEPSNARTDWGKLTRDAEHLGLIAHAVDGEGRERTTRSKRPATNSSLVFEWTAGPAITGRRDNARSDSA